MSEDKLFNKYGTVVDSGKVVFKENDIGDQMYIIKEGNVRISKMIGGKEHILAVLGKGDFFGEMAIVNRVKRTATATAAGTVHILAFTREGFIRMIEKNAGIALNIIDKLCKRLHQTDLQIQHLVKKNERGLIALNLYYAFAEAGMENAILSYHKITRDLSLNLELPKENVITFFNELRDQGIIKVEEGKLVLCDRDKLTGIVENTERKG